MRPAAIALTLGFAVVLLAPFLLRSDSGASQTGAWRLIIVSPHGEAIRYEFERGFARWHEEKFGQPVVIEWRSIGGTTEISRYLDAQMLASFRRHWTQTLGKTWSEDIGRAAQDSRLARDKATPEQWEARQTYLDDEHTPLDCGIDVFFGGGPFDHNRQALLGNSARVRLLTDEKDALEFIPQRFRGEDYYAARLDAQGHPNRAFDRWYGPTLSSFGICYNLDRLAEAGISHPPRQWSDLTDPLYFRRIGAADPTKSSSITKCFEMMIQQQMWIALKARGIVESNYEIAARDRESDVKAALAEGWREGLRVILLIGANARYFTDWSNKVPIDVGQGDAAAGMCVDFYGRFQSQYTLSADGQPRMVFVNPYDAEHEVGGSSVNADPVSILRMGTESQPSGDRPYRRVLARRFVDFMLDDASQKLWTFRAGEPGGPEKYTQRRVAVRRDFFTDENRRHMADPDLNTYEMKEFLTYHEEWTAPQFNALRQIIKCMCIDCGVELRSAWGAIIDEGGPQSRANAAAALTQLPAFTVEVEGKMQPVTLEYGEGMDAFVRLLKGNAVTQLALGEALTNAVRKQYAEAEALAHSGP